MNYKHASVIDSAGLYVTFVLVLQGICQDGTVTECVQQYKVRNGESLIYTDPPVKRIFAGAVGFIKPKWAQNAMAWTESASLDEIAAWELEHPAPVAPPSVPTNTELAAMQQQTDEVLITLYEGQARQDTVIAQQDEAIIAIYESGGAV